MSDEKQPEKQLKEGEVPRRKMTFERFCRDYIPAHPELNLGEDDMSATAFARVAKKHGKELGFQFSDAEIQSVLGEHRRVRKQITDLGAAAKASANGTAMCYNGAIRTDDPIDADWLVISAKPRRR